VDVVGFTSEGPTNGFYIGTYAPFNGEAVGANYYIKFERALINTTAGTTPVLSGGTSPPSVTLSGTTTTNVSSTGSGAFVIQITSAGALGTAFFKWSSDGGKTFSTPQATSATPIMLGSTGITVHFVSGTYSTNNIYLAQGWSGACFDAAMEYTSTMTSLAIKRCTLGWGGCLGTTHFANVGGITFEDTNYTNLSTLVDFDVNQTFYGLGPTSPGFRWFQTSHSSPGQGYNCIPAVNGYDMQCQVAIRSAALRLSSGKNSDVPNPYCASVEITGPTATFTITGIASGTEGQIMYLLNLTNQEMDLQHDNGSDSTSGNRLLLPGGSGTGGNGTLTLPVATGGFSWAKLKYSSSRSRWLVLDHS
jgi:hypothetical protein